MNKKEVEAAIATLPPMSDEDLKAQREVMSQLMAAIPPELLLGPRLPSFPEKRGADFDEKFRAAIIQQCGADSVFLKLYNKYRELGLTQFSISWGPDAINKTQEERAQIMLDLLSIDPAECKPYFEPPEWWADVEDGRG